MLKFDAMTVEELQNCLYEAETSGDWQTADDIALYIESMELNWHFDEVDEVHYTDEEAA